MNLLGKNITKSYLSLDAEYIINIYSMKWRFSTNYFTIVPSQHGPIIIPKIILLNNIALKHVCEDISFRSLPIWFLEIMPLSFRAFTYNLPLNYTRVMYLMLARHFSTVFILKIYFNFV